MHGRRWLPPETTSDAAVLLTARGVRAFADGFISVLLPVYLRSGHLKRRRGQPELNRQTTLLPTPGMMIHRAVVSEESRSPNPEPRLNVEPDEVHLVLTGLELDIIVDALRSVGNVELADRLESVLRRLGQNHTSR